MVEIFASGRFQPQLLHLGLKVAVAEQQWQAGQDAGWWRWSR
jgi:hypothetical protein